MSLSADATSRKRKHTDRGAKVAKSRSKKPRVDVDDVDAMGLSLQDEVATTADTTGADETDRIQEKSAAPKAQRFIVFIGNLPFTATTESIQAHFVKIKPKSVRHLTQKGTDKSKGFAFLEFDAYDRMRTCLKLYHHSLFDDGKSGARKINVELTAGGGGAKSENRKEKLKVKNQKLNEERKRRAIEEAKAKEKADQRAAKKAAREKRKQAKSGAGESVVEPRAIAEPEPQIADQSDIHPSRRAQMAHP